MLMAVASFIGKAAFREIIRTLVAEQAEQVAIGELTEELTEKLEAKAIQRPKVLGIESETWYTFRFAKERYWTQANRFLASDMSTLVSEAYNDVRARTGVPPFVLSASSSYEGITLDFRRAPRSEGFNREVCRDTAVNAVRKSMRAYVRSVAAGVPVR